MKRNNNYLDFIPVLRENVSFSPAAHAPETIEITVRHTGFFDRLAQKFFKTPASTTTAPEGQGSFVFPLIDGKRSVYEIALATRERFGAEAEPVFERVSRFMNTLERQGLITVTKPKSRKEAGGKRE